LYGRDGGQVFLDATVSLPAASTGFAGFVSTVPVCAGDVDVDGLVDVSDLLDVLAAWGTSDADADCSGTTDVSDLLEVLAGWGTCV
jgi:hypothetical protein